MSNPSPLDVLLDGMKLHHERARRHLEQVTPSGRYKTEPDKREELELAAAKELKVAADYAKAAIAYTQERARATAEPAQPVTVEVLRSDDPRLNEDDDAECAAAEPMEAA